MIDELCSKCIGATKVMIPKTNNKKGFEYIDCTLCKGTGVISKELEEDFILSLNEDSLETNDDW